MLLKVIAACALALASGVPASRTPACSRACLRAEPRRTDVHPGRCDARNRRLGFCPEISADLCPLTPSPRSLASGLHRHSPTTPQAPARVLADVVVCEERPQCGAMFASSRGAATNLALAAARAGFANVHPRPACAPSCARLHSTPLSTACRGFERCARPPGMLRRLGDHRGAHVARGWPQHPTGFAASAIPASSRSRASTAAQRARRRVTTPAPPAMHN